MDLLIEGFVNGIELYMDIFDSINIMSRVTDNIRIAVYFLPTPAKRSRDFSKNGPEENFQLKRVKKIILSR